MKLIAVLVGASLFLWTRVKGTNSKRMVHYADKRKHGNLHIFCIDKWLLPMVPQPLPLPRDVWQAENGMFYSLEREKVANCTECCEAAEGAQS